MKTIKSLSDELNINSSSIYNWCLDNKIVKTNGRYWLNDLQVEMFKAKPTRIVDANPKQVRLSAEEGNKEGLFGSRQVSKMLDLSQAQVVSWCKRNDVAKYGKGFKLNRTELTILANSIYGGRVRRQPLQENNKKTETSTVRRRILDIKLKQKPKRTMEQMKLDIPPASKKIDLINLKLKKLKIMTELTQLDLKREELAIELDKVVG